MPPTTRTSWCCAATAAALNQDYIESYGLYIDLDYENIPADCEKRSMWVITLPDGMCFCEYSHSLNLFATGSTYWEIYSLDWSIGRNEGLVRRGAPG